MKAVENGFRRIVGCRTTGQRPVLMTMRRALAGRPRQAPMQATTTKGRLAAG
jgi:hypothetical protein